MKLRRASNSQTVHLDPSSEQKGGEGSVYWLRHSSDLAAKIYHDPAHTNVRKLRAMLSAPPHDPMERAGHMSIAWPIDLLVEHSGRTVGFLMPRAKRSTSLFTFIRPKLRRKEHPAFTYRGLHRLARNVASLVSAVHMEGHVVSDINMHNVLATEAALACLIDCDSFQIRDPGSRRVFVCEVGMPEFTPPEHQGKQYSRYQCNETHDRFGLGVLLFMLLMEGNHPFAGRYLGTGDAPTLEERIAAGHWPYARLHRGRYRPRPASPPPLILNPDLQRLFHRCFVEGYGRPQVRPDARTWKDVLERAEHDLVRCQSNPQHWYGDHCQDCPWCPRKDQLGTDPYPPHPGSRRRTESPPASERLGFSTSGLSTGLPRKTWASSTSGFLLDQLKRGLLEKLFQLLVSALESAFSTSKGSSGTATGGNTISVDSDSVELNRNPVKIK